MTALQLMLLGGFDIVGESGAAVKPPTRKARALVAYLAMRNGAGMPW